MPFLCSRERHYLSFKSVSMSGLLFFPQRQALTPSQSMYAKQTSLKRYPEGRQLVSLLARCAEKQTIHGDLSPNNTCT